MVRYIQLWNPITKRYTKVDSLTGSIVSRKKTKGPYKNVKIIGQRCDIYGMG